MYTPVIGTRAGRDIIFFVVQFSTRISSLHAEGGNVKAGSDGVGLPVITVVTVSVSAGIAMGITGCLIGALLHKAVMAHSKKKVVVQPNQSQTHTEPPHLYDEVTLTSSSLHQSVLQCSANEGRRNVIVTIPNDAYIDSSAIKRK